MKKLLTMLLNLTLCFLFFGCYASMPEKKDFNSDECFQESLCQYFSSHSEKAIDCSAISVRCTDSEKEKRMLKRYEYCKNDKNRWKNKDAQSCWDKLNSK